MSGEDWVCAREALRRAEAAGYTEVDLLLAARSTSTHALRTRAKRGIFSDDVLPGDIWADCARTFTAADLPRTKNGVTVGPWPDIPTSFWDGQLTHRAWSSGTFASKVHYLCEYHQELTHEYIELFEVTFHANDLLRLLGGQATNPMRGSLPSNATKNDRLYEDHAHRAAELIRSRRVGKAEAFRQVLKVDPPAPHLTEESQQRALRQAYDRIYDNRGMPIQN